MNTRFTRRALLLAAAVLAATVAAGVAFGTIPGSGGVINGCYGSSGLLRVIDVDAGGKCTASERPISWNEQGPKGDAGLRGEQGPKGDPGPQGPQGLQG